MAVVQTSVGDFVFEVAIEVTHRRGATVTRHPVEGRRSLADHVYVQPAQVTLRGLTSATPLSSGDSEDPTRLGTAWDGVTALLGQVVTVVTEREVYPEMVVTSLTLPQTPDTGDALSYEMTLEEIRVAERRDVLIPPEAPPPAKKPAAASKVDRGSQTGTPAKEADAEKSRSILAQLLGV